MPLQATSGAASYDGFGGGVAAVPNYIEDVFNVWLYQGNSSTQTITNGIDLAGKGGLVWTKARGTPNGTVRGHYLFDGSGSSYSALHSNTTGSRDVGYYINYNADGFSFPFGDASWNNSGDLFASWTFRKQPKFFDVVTYTGNGVAGRTIAHNLGSVPACIIVKATSNNAEGLVYHKDLGATKYLTLFSAANGANAADTWTGAWNDTAPTSTNFTVGSGSNANADGWTFVAYLFAHNAGGFGLTGTDNVISCGSFTAGTGSVNLGYEPQWIMFKGLTGLNGWIMFDTMRGCPTEAPNKLLMAQSSAAEGDTYVSCQPTATGFKYNFSPDCIYIAIRRGPMKVPTDATKVFNPVLGLTTAPAFVSSNFNSGIDSAINFYKPGYTGYPRWSSRLTGTGVIPTSSTAAESAVSVNTFDYMNGFYNLTGLGTDFGAWMFRRAPSFFDEVCYTGNATAFTAITHNLGVVPELMIVKNRTSSGYNWIVYSSAIGATKYLTLNQVDAPSTSSSVWSNTSPTATNFTIGTSAAVNAGADNFVAYLFATCAGVSKVGSYTGTGTTKQVDCGFTAGSRFVLIKRTDSTGDWYVWDSARGIVSGNDPYLLLNSTAAEVTNTDYIDTYSAGFEISSTAPAAINASGGTFIFLAIA